MLKIKLARFGKRNQPHYRIVINEARSKRDGQYVEKIGHYAPTQSPKLLEINLERYDYWVSQGAQPTDTVASLDKKFRSGDPFPAKNKQPSKKVLAKQAEEEKKKQEEKEAQKAAKKEEKAAVEVKDEAKAEEAPVEKEKAETEKKEEKTEETAEKKDAKSEK